MRRRSIIDVAGGHQPIQNEDGTVRVVFNGEIYNFRTLQSTQTDTEVIVLAYEEYGVDCVKLFNGIFAFALWDSSSRLLFIARDRMGVKPLYYAQMAGEILFASEIKAPNLIMLTFLSSAWVLRQSLGREIHLLVYIFAAIFVSASIILIWTDVWEYPVPYQGVESSRAWNAKSSAHVSSK